MIEVPGIMGKLRDEHNDRTMVERIDPLMGTVLDNRYRIDFRLAAGGFGAIYRATQIETGQQFAVKVLHGELATNDARVIARFRREIDTLRTLKNPHTIAAYEDGEAPDGSLYVVMELLHGESLYEQFRSKGPLAWQRVVSIGMQVCASLAEAHSLNIIHRDLKPANIHLENHDGNPDFVKVLDFGIAKIIGESAVDAMELTQAGQMIGTFDYMAPEQMVGGQCTGRTDIYTLGIVLYEMVTGRRPFADAASPTAMLAALLTQTPPPLDVPGVPRDLERILMKCLEREPQNRYEDVREMRDELERLLRPADAMTRKMNATPAPVLYPTQDEATVVAQPRPKRGSQPHVMRRDEPAVTVEQRPRRASEPQTLRRDESPGTDNIERRKRPSEPPPPARAKRETANVVRRDRDSQPVPLAPQPDPNAWQSLQIPKNRDRESQNVPILRRDERDSVPTLPADPPRRASTPTPPPDPPRPTPQPPGFAPVTPPVTPAPYAGAFHAVDPAQPLGAYAQPYLPTPTPAPAPIPLTPTPPPLGQYAQVIPHTPSPDPRISVPSIDSKWQRYPVAQKGSVPGYDLGNMNSRDAMVRRVVWALALILGVILVIVVMSRL